MQATQYGLPAPTLPSRRPELVEVAQAQSYPRPSAKIGKRQREVLQFIIRQLEDQGFPPTIREIGLACDLHSSSTVHSHLVALERKGYIQRNKKRPRSLIVLQDANREPPSSAADRLRRELLDAQAENAQLLAENAALRERLSVLAGGNVDSFPQAASGAARA